MSNISPSIQRELVSQGFCAHHSRHFTGLHRTENNVSVEVQLSGVVKAYRTDRPLGFPSPFYVGTLSSVEAAQTLVAEVRVIEERYLKANGYVH